MQQRRHSFRILSPDAGFYLLLSYCRSPWQFQKETNKPNKQALSGQTCFEQHSSARLHKQFSPVPVDEKDIRFWKVVKEVTPPNFLLAHLTSSSSWVGMSSLWTLLGCWLACMPIDELWLSCKAEVHVLSVSFIKRQFPERNTVIMASAVKRHECVCVSLIATVTQEWLRQLFIY